ncbi:apolipoprotein N-acyltransferase [Acidipropionibacterium virtanenii]|uniref:Apolipoprotein N-acyltransferase n=1 Tax=Acidipropionibacterium virtanenii TaxID=2057246 RepID=A0A344UUD3_9ACTN|nr:apolipoprotein N-acyltransferase [Acidipropionibacterium virtanenii]AXE38881.1 Apolipoprotein N-acyltransferase [Acidipropionibacterium virtanenii]
MRRIPTPDLARAAVAVAAGVATGLGQAPAGWWPLVIPGVAALTVLVRDRRPRTAAGLGYLYGLGLFTTTIWWVYVVAWPAAPVLIAFMACWAMLTGWGIRMVARLPLAPLWAACVWSAAEVAAAHIPLGGFGWVRLAWTAVDTPLAGTLRWIGATGTSLLIALAGQLLAAAISLGAAPRAPRRARIAAVATLVGVLSIASGVGEWTTRRPDPAGGDVRVTVVQGGVDGTAGSYAMGYARSVTDNHLSETIAAVAHQRATGAPAPDMILWPENSTDIDPVLDAQTHELVTTAIAVAGRPILVGAVTEGPGADERQTTAMWWPVDSQGPDGVYHKRNLVPFGEWVPWRDALLKVLPILQHVGRQSVPGTAPGVLTARTDRTDSNSTVRIGDVICFELAYDGTVHDTVRHGAQLLMVQSNNATYTGTAQPDQQWQITRARAIESGRQITVATTSSLSGLIQPSGRVVDRTRESTHDYRTYELSLGDGVSAGVRAAPVIGWSSTALAGLAVLAGAVMALRRRRRAPSSARPPGATDNV